MVKEPQHKFNLVFFRNSNAMDIIINKTNTLYPGKLNYQRSITYKTVGGVIDFKFFLGKTPDDAVT